VSGCPDRRVDARPMKVAMVEPGSSGFESFVPYCGVGCQLIYNIKDDKIL